MIDVAVVGIGSWSAAFRGWPALTAAVTEAWAEAADDAVTDAAIASSNEDSAAASRATDRPPMQIDAPAATAATAAPTRPSPTLLPPAERRRAPDGVAVALEVASEAVAMAAAGTASTLAFESASASASVSASSSASTAPMIEPTTLATVFTSAHGDLAIVDYLCTTLATDPTALSPTRFHLSVHNAAAGNWSIATHDQAPSTALAGGDDSFALGLLEAATMAVAEDRPVLLVAFDTPATGLLAHGTHNTALFGFAMIVTPLAAALADGVTLALALDEEAAPMPAPRAEALQALAASSPAARALAVAEVLATMENGADLADSERRVRYPIGPSTTLSIDIRRGAAATLRDRAIE